MTTTIDNQEQQEFQPTDPENFMRETEKAANQAVENAQEVLALLPESERQREETRLREEAIRNYKTARINGHENDMWSYDPGIKVYLNKAGLEEITKKCQANGFPIAKSDIKQIDQDTWEISLPRGSFSLTGMGIQFHKDFTDNGQATRPRLIENPRKYLQAFGLPANRIKRIECDSGRLWQNPQYSWDLSRKATGR